MAPLNLTNYIPELNLEIQPNEWSFTLIGGHSSLNPNSEGEGYNGGLRIRYYPFYDNYTGNPGILHGLSLGLEGVYTYTDKEDDDIEALQRKSGFAVGALLGYKLGISGPLWVDASAGYQVAAGGRGPVASVLVGVDFDWLGGKIWDSWNPEPNITLGDTLEMVKRSEIKGGLINVEGESGSYETVLCRNLRNNKPITIFINSRSSLRFQPNKFFEITKGMQWASQSSYGYMKKQIMVVGGARSNRAKQFLLATPADMLQFLPGAEYEQQTQQLIQLFENVAPTPTHVLGKAAKAKKAHKYIKKASKANDRLNKGVDYAEKFMEVSNKLTEQQARFINNKTGIPVGELLKVKRGAAKLAWELGNQALDLIAKIDDALNPMKYLDDLMDKGPLFQDF